jgi:hypothetical protein
MYLSVASADSAFDSIRLYSADITQRNYSSLILFIMYTAYIRKFQIQVLLLEIFSYAAFHL